MTDHLEQTTVGMEVLGVLLHVLGQAVDAVGENSDLNFGGTGVALVGRVLGNDLVLFFLENHVISPHKLFTPRSEYRDR